MLDWKILASAFIALVIVSFILLEGFGAVNFFSNTFGSIGEWFGSSPFGGMVPGSEGKHVSVMLYPSNLTLEPEGEVNIETGSVNLTGFAGGIHSDFDRNIIVLKETGSKLEVAVPMRNVRIEGFRLDKFSLDDARFMIAPNITAENGTIEFRDFSGSATFKSGGLELVGNVSTLTAKIGELNLDLN
jgi:hypothetical protein